MLKVEAEQRRDDEPGWCQLRIEGQDATPGRVELLFRRAGASRNFLGASDWQDQEEWLPFEAHSAGAALQLRIGPPHTLRLGRVTTVELRVRRPGGAEARTRLAWPKIVLPATNTLKEEQPAPRSAPAAPTLDPAEDSWVDLRAEPAAPVIPARRSGLAWPLAGAALLLVLALAAAALFYFGYAIPGAGPSAPTVAEEGGPRSFTEESLRAFLAGQPDGPTAFAEAELYRQAGHPDLALLIYRHAARRGEGRAALAIGQMYDPELFSPETSAFAAPDADQAASFYKQAAEEGDPEAQFRLGRLLRGGRTSGSDDAERGVVWLQRAADQGHGGAQDMLQQLQN